jgi:biotin transport system substrate-specific component
VGLIIEKIRNPKVYHFFFANLAGLLVVYAVGVPYLYMALNMWMEIPTTWAHAVTIGFVYSIAGDIVVSATAGMLAVKLYRVKTMGTGPLSHT